MAPEIAQQALSRSYKRILVEQNLNPQRHAEASFGDQLCGPGSCDDPWQVLTLAGRPVTTPADPTFVASDLDLEDLRVFGARKILEGQPTPITIALVLG